MTSSVGFRALPIAALSAMLALFGSAVGNAADEEPSGAAAGTLRYVPPSADFPARRIGPGSRGMGRFSTVQILAPDHLGYTISEQPTLYWYLSQPTATRIEFTLRDETSVEPLVDTVLPPAQAGIQTVRLADFGVKLAVGTRYLWFVSLVTDPEQRSKDFTSGAWIERRAPEEALRARLAVAGGNEARVYAENALWYDAIGALSARIAKKPADAALVEQRAALLDQAGLSEVAAYDREQATKR